MGRAGLQSRQEAVDLPESDSLAAAGHEEAVANFIKPQNRDQRALFREACKNCQAVLPIRFVFEKPLERERCVQNKITHRRWPS